MGRPRAEGGGVDYILPHLDVGAREGGSAQRLLSLIHGTAPRHAEYECRLIWGGSARCDAEATVPALVNALARILEVQLDALFAQPQGVRIWCQELGFDPRPLYNKLVSKSWCAPF